MQQRFTLTFGLDIEDYSILDIEEIGESRFGVTVLENIGWKKRALRAISNKPATTPLIYSCCDAHHLRHLRYTKVKGRR
ncbi:hypothetical protein CH76_09925 [Lysinibacillus sp. BF-4]|nr:hypothetical protein CH76_09925 [Lysinibacillus sp. BF-4]